MCWETQFCLFICLFCLQSSKVKCWLMGLLCSGSLLSTWSFIGTVKRHLLILATHLNVAVTSRVSWPRLSSWSQYQWQDGNTRLLSHWNWMCNSSLIFILWEIFMTYFPTSLRMHRELIIKTKTFSHRFTFALGTLLTSHIACPQVFQAPSRGAPYLWSGPPVGLITSCSVPPLWPILEFYRRVCISLSYWQRWWRVSYISISPTLGEGCDPSSVSYTHLLSVPGENHTGRPNRAAIFLLLPISA